MPSLRRSFSSPSVRSSPYPTFLSSPNPSSNRSRTAGLQPRRSSGSATTERRVLADIEWWRVHDGQCDLDIQAHDDAQTLDVDVPAGGTVTLSASGGSLEPPQTPLSLHSFSLDLTQSVHTDGYAALSIAPYPPPARRNGRDSAPSSVESTPELTTAPLEVVHFGLARVTPCPFGDELPLPASLTPAGGRQAHPLFGLLPGLSRQGSFEPDFGDMGGDFFSLDQNLFQ